MSTPKILNMRGPLPIDMRNAVYVGRPSKFGNPFSHLGGTLAQFKVRTRAESILAYRGYICVRPKLIADVRRELRGKDLICWCFPESCHAEILLEIANEKQES